VGVRASPGPEELSQPALRDRAARRIPEDSDAGDRGRRHILCLLPLLRYADISGFEVLHELREATARLARILRIGVLA
jgi:hypothetical protein